MYEVLGRNYNVMKWEFATHPVTIFGVIKDLIVASWQYDVIDVKVRYSPMRRKLA